jgi:Tol biopolymer transport system component
MSGAPAFLPGDLPSAGILVRDLSAHRTELVSVASDGEPANSFSAHPSISANGRFVAFDSIASNFAPVSGVHTRVFVRDRRTRDTVLVTPVVEDAGHPAISADGQVVAYTLTRGRRSAVYAYDRATDTTTRVDVSSSGRAADRSSDSPAISATGRFVAFRSKAGNLVRGDRNSRRDVFVRDRRTGTTRRVSIPPHGSSFGPCRGTPLCVQAPGISANGRYVVFATGIKVFDRHSGRGGVFLHDRRTHRTVRVSYARNGRALVDVFRPSISPDGRFVTFTSPYGLLIRGPLS